MTLSFAPERIETWPLERLKPYARNAKTHGADQVAKIAGSMARFGWTVPVLVAGDGEVIAGHGRILAAAELGLTEAPVIVLDHLTEEQRRAYRLADNRLAESEWDEALLASELQELAADEFDLSLIGFSDAELDQLLAFDVGGGDATEGASVPPVVVPEPPRNPASRTGDLWILGDHRLLCGDSTSAVDVRRLMNGERAALFCTDPPYLVDYDGSNHPTRNKDWSPSYGVTWDDSSQGDELYDGFIAAAIAEAITEDAAWYCWHASRRQAMLEACWEKAGAFVHQQIIWVKDRGVLTRSHYLWKHEPCFMGWVRPQGFAQVAPIKGVEGFNRASPVSGPTYVDATEAGRRIRRGARLWTVAVSTFKAETYRFLRLDRPTAEELSAGATFPPGTVHLPDWVDDEWLKQFVAEQLVTVKMKRGFARLEWQKLRERNEALDCWVYARAAAWIAGADRWSEARWADLAAQLGAGSDDADAPPSAGSVRPVRQLLRRRSLRSSYMG